MYTFSIHTQLYSRPRVPHTVRYIEWDKKVKYQVGAPVCIYTLHRRLRVVNSYK